MKEIINITKELIRFKSTYENPDQIQKCADHIENYLNAHEIVFRRFNYNGIPSIFAGPENRPVKTLLMSHIDVVDGPDELFEPIEKNGGLYGRGSVDDKYAAALSLVLLKNQLQKLKKNGLSQEHLTAGILITGDEEKGGANGAAKVIPDIKADFCIALDGGSINKMVTKEKGVLWLKLIAKGASAHGSRPWLGENAIENLIQDYLKLKPLFDPTGNDPKHWHRTMNFSKIRAGKSVNQVPDYAEAMFDIRYTENDDIDSLINRMQDRIKGEIVIEEKGPLFFSGESPYLDLLLDISKETKTDFEHGASDARFLSDHGIPAVVWGANGEMSQHSADEHVNIESVYTLYILLDAYYEHLNEIDGVGAV